MPSSRSPDRCATVEERTDWGASETQLISSRVSCGARRPGGRGNEGGTRVLEVRGGVVHRSDAEARSGGAKSRAL